MRSEVPTTGSEYLVEIQDLCLSCACSCGLAELMVGYLSPLIQKQGEMLMRGQEQEEMEWKWRREYVSGYCEGCSCVVVEIYDTTFGDRLSLLGDTFEQQS
jgi:hypothetical protein